MQNTMGIAAWENMKNEDLGGKNLKGERKRRTIAYKTSKKDSKMHLLGL